MEKDFGELVKEFGEKTALEMMYDRAEHARKRTMKVGMRVKARMVEVKASRKNAPSAADLHKLTGRTRGTVVGLDKLNHTMFVKVDGDAETTEWYRGYWEAA